MSEFEHNLWLEIVRDHGDELARAGRPLRTHRKATRHRLLAGTTVGVAASATAAALLLGASTSPPAFAVTRNPDGTVTVRLERLSGIAGANEKLAAMGLRARIAALSKSPPTLVCPGGTAPTITIDPRIAERQVLILSPGQPGASDAAAPKAHGTRSANAAATSGGGNRVVRMSPSGGKLRTSSGAGNHLVRMSCP